MAQISIRDLSFSYPGSDAPVFEHVDLSLDTDWRLGLVGRNGRGKTTFLNLLRGRLQGSGQISAPVAFEYFPFAVERPARPALAVAREIIAPFDEWEAQMQALAQKADPYSMAEYGTLEEQYAACDGYTIDDQIRAEAGRLGLHPAVLETPFEKLSGGEQVKLQLAALFLKKHRFLLIDEPTDHLDAAGRRLVGGWMATKQGFILVSHDRAFLDRAADHILSINKADIELQKGNYTSWQQNRARQDAFEQAENRRLAGNIASLEEAVRRTRGWSDKVESTKTNAAKRGGGLEAARVDRGHIGRQAARMMQRSKAIERRKQAEIDQKRTLLHNVEEAEPVRFALLAAPKNPLVQAQKLALRFGERNLFKDLSFSVAVGERIRLEGTNGSGKSSLLRVLTGRLAPSDGVLRLAGGFVVDSKAPVQPETHIRYRLGNLTVSAVPQNTNFLQGDIRAFAAREELELSLFLAILRKLEMPRAAFEQPLETLSAGQKKKVCLAASLSVAAHLFVWDEPLNYVDILTRRQLEQAIAESAPTMLFVEHDAAFCEAVATRTLLLSPG